MRRVRGLLAAATAVLWLLAAAPASAFPLTGCSLGLTSFDASGTPIGVATSGDETASRTDPLDVDWDGKVDYHGTSGSVISNFTYHVEVYGIPTPLQGSGDNNRASTTTDDSIVPGDALPFQITGLYYVSGELTGSGGTCTGSGWVRLAGDPLTSPLFGAAVITGILGLVLLAAALPGRHTFRGLLGGAFAGIGAALGSVVTGVGIAEMPLAEYAPLEILLAILFIGTILGWVKLGGDTKGDRDAERDSKCTELAARYKTMLDRRARLMAGLTQGIAQLSRAIVASREAATARERLATEQAQALALLGTAGAVATGALAAAAATVGAVSSALTSAVAWVGDATAAGGAAILDYIPVLAGGSSPELGLGVQAVNQATAAAATAYSDATNMAALASGTGSATAATVGSLLSSGMTQVDAAMARANAMRDQLAAACAARQRELSELDADIGQALRDLATCPNVDKGQLADPRTPIPTLPSDDGSPPRG